MWTIIFFHYYSTMTINIIAPFGLFEADNISIICRRLLSDSRWPVSLILSRRQRPTVWRERCSTINEKQKQKKARIPLGTWRGGRIKYYSTVLIIITIKIIICCNNRGECSCSVANRRRLRLVCALHINRRLKSDRELVYVEAKKNAQ